jgi:PAS domain S-box-containing protein
LLFTDQEGVITSANMAMLHLTEYNNLVGQNVRILMPPEIAQRHDEYVARYHETKIGNVVGNGGRMVPLVTKSGKRKIVMKSVGEVRGGFIASLMDLTASMRLQEEKTRTSEAERAVDERSQFISFLNHELRVPMNALSLAIALLNEKRDKTNACVKSYDQHLKDMRSCCDQIVHLLNDVLDIERMRANVYKYEYGPADMSQLVTKAKNISLMACGEKVRGVDFLVNVSPVFQTYRLWCDEQRLLQVLINFITASVEELIGKGTRRKARKSNNRDSCARVNPQIVVSVNCTWRDQVSADDFLKTGFQVSDGAVPIDLSIQVWFIRAIVRADKCADECADECTDERTDECTDECRFERADECIDECRFERAVVERTREKPEGKEGKEEKEVAETKVQFAHGKHAKGKARNEVDEARAYIDSHLYTPADETNSYMGLGLAIAREIIEKGHFGTVHRWTKQSTTTLEARISAFVVPGTYTESFQSIGLAGALSSEDGGPMRTRERSDNSSSISSSSSSSSSSSQPSSEDRESDAQNDEEEDIGEPGMCDVLYVEDDALNRRVVSQLLLAAGFSTRVCENGRFAIEWFATPGNECKVVVMDRTMPEVNGEQATRQILTIRPRQKIIGLTGDTEARHVGNMKEAGVLRVLSKPVSHTVLIQAIREVIDQKEAQTAYICLS